MKVEDSSETGVEVVTRVKYVQKSHPQTSLLHGLMGAWSSKIWSRREGFPSDTEILAGVKVWVLARMHSSAYSISCHCSEWRAAQEKKRSGLHWNALGLATVLERAWLCEFQTLGKAELAAAMARPAEKKSDQVFPNTGYGRPNTFIILKF